MGKLISTLVGVIAAVGGFTALWVGANLLFNQSTRNFRLFSSLIGAIIGAIVMLVVDGNRLLTGVVARPEFLFNGDDPGVFSADIGTVIGAYLFWPAVGAVVGAALGYALGVVEHRQARLIIGVGGGTAIGVILSFALKSRYELAMRSVPLIVWTVALLVVGLGLAALTRRNLAKGAITGLLIGWLLGAFGGALQGVSASNQLETTVAFAVAGALVGARLGLSPRPDLVARARISDQSRAWIFVGPAVAFITIMLILPTIQTGLLSVQEPDAANLVDGFVGLENYRTVFADQDNFTSESAAGLFTSPSEESTSWFPWGGSALMPWVVFFAAVGILLAVLLGRETGQSLNFSGAPVVPLVLAGTFFAFAVFTHLRGTVINNIWWVVAVTLLSTTLGLAFARLADGAKYEAVAKSFVFMPMAISMVGASIIWRLMMYQARDVSKSQTGLFNAVWVWLGSQTTTWGVGKIVIGGIFLLAALALMWTAYRSLSSSPSSAGLFVAFSAIPLWVAFRTFGDGIGGFLINEDGTISAQTVNFVQDGPYNNFWLMVILIWIQTGFAMVILSAAIKAVPGDFIEAAKIDGANDNQIFWRITLPQIAATIGVVATTTMVGVMKVFDIVKVTTNGQFGSQVLANAMFKQAFQLFNREIGAALAMLLFLGILPVMVFNVYRLTQEEA